MKKFLITKLKFWIIIGIAFLYFGGKVYYKEKIVYPTWDNIEGTISDIRSYNKTKSDGEKKAVFDITVSYQYKDKQKQVQRNEWSGPTKLKVGDPYLVRINPQNPEDVIITKGSADLLIWICFGFGTFFFLTGLMAFRIKN